MRKIALQAAGFRNEGEDHLLDTLKLTKPSQAITWQGILNASVLNPFVKELKIGEPVSITVLEGEKEVATFDTLYVRLRRVRPIDVRNYEMRLEFRNREPEQ